MGIIRLSARVGWLTIPSSSARTQYKLDVGFPLPMLSHVHGSTFESLRFSSADCGWLLARSYSGAWRHLRLRCAASTSNTVGGALSAVAAASLRLLSWSQRTSETSTSGSVCSCRNASTWRPFRTCLGPWSSSPSTSRCVRSRFVCCWCCSGVVLVLVVTAVVAVLCTAHFCDRTFLCCVVLCCLCDVFVSAPT